MDAPFNIPPILSFPAALLVGGWMQYVKPTRPDGIRFCARQTADINYGALATRAAEWPPPPPPRPAPAQSADASNRITSNFINS